MLSPGGEPRSLGFGESSSSEDEAPAHQLARGTGVQMRRSRWRAVPEFREKVRVTTTVAAIEGRTHLREPAVLGGVALPAGARVLARGGQSFRGEGGADTVVVVVGIPWTPTEFVDQARAVGDPF